MYLDMSVNNVSDIYTYIYIEREKGSAHAG